MRYRRDMSEESVRGGFIYEEEHEGARSLGVSESSTTVSGWNAMHASSYIYQQLEEDPSVVRILAACLERLLILDDHDLEPTKFHSVRPPTINILQYLQRIHQYANCSNSCLVIALIYIDRLCQQASVPLSELTVHRILITAVCLAAKFYEDFFYPNLFYAQLGGIPLIELNSLEVEFLFGIDFALYVSADIYTKYEDALFRSYAATRNREPSFSHRFSHSSSDTRNNNLPSQNYPFSQPPPPPGLGR